MTYSTDGAGEIFDAFLKEANSRLLPYGLPKTLTEDNFEEVLEDMKADSDNALFRLKLNSIRDELKALKSYKDGVVSYTDAVGETADGSTELKDGISELKEQSDELFDTYFKVETNNLTFFLSADENPRISAAADDQQINKFAGLVAGVIIMILFTYVISVFIIHGIEKESSVNRRALCAWRDEKRSDLSLPFAPGNGDLFIRAHRYGDRIQQVGRSGTDAGLL